LKKALTLIELLFTIVIIAAVFTVIPKIIYVSNKTLEFTKKEDAVFNMIAKIMDISLKEYDEMNTEYDDILLTDNNNFLECNKTSGYRQGGFSGSRNCFDGVKESSLLGADSNEPPYDDVDDYDGDEENTTKNGKTVYKMNVSVGYTPEWSLSNYNGDEFKFQFSKNSSSSKTNIKRVYVTVSHNGETVTSASYYSSNIGHIRIESVQW